MAVQKELRHATIQTTMNVYGKANSEAVLLSNQEMRNRVAHITISCVMMSIAVYGADNSIGTWKMNLEKSRFPTAGPNMRKNVSIVYEAIDGGVKAITKLELSDGRTITGGYTAKYDGLEYPVTGAATDIISIRQIDANTFVIDERKTGGKRRTRGRKIISDDGKTMTFTLEGTDDQGNSIKAAYVYEKQ